MSLYSQEKQVGERAARSARIASWLDYWRRVAWWMAIPLVLLGLARLMSLVGIKVSEGGAFVVFLIIVAEMVVAFVWALSRREDTWRHFRVWAGFVVGITAVCLGVFFFSKGTPPPKNTPRCGTGDAIMMVVLPMMALCCVFGGWLVFGAAKTTINAVKPGFYKAEGVWTGASDVAASVGGVSMYEGESDLEGLLSHAAPDGALSLD